MAYALLSTSSIVIPSPAGSLIDFVQAESVNDLRLVNNSSSSVTVTLWFDYNGTSAGNPEYFGEFSLQGKGDKNDRDKRHITGLWVFANGGRITGLCSTGDAATIHISRATV